MRYKYYLIKGLNIDSGIEGLRLGQGQYGGGGGGGVFAPL